MRHRLTAARPEQSVRVRTHSWAGHLPLRWSAKRIDDVLRARGGSAVRRPGRVRLEGVLVAAQVADEQTMGAVAELRLDAPVAGGRLRRDMTLVDIRACSPGFVVSGAQLRLTSAR